MDSKKARSVAKRIKIFTIAQLALWLECSVPVARRHLKKWGAITSYNQNARFYALPEVVEFDRNGIWRYEQAAFSRHGNLKQTVLALVCAAPAGLKSGELGEALGLDPRSFLAPFRHCPELVREASGRSFVWFSVDRHHAQQKARQALGKPQLSDHDALLVLLAWIKQPTLEIDDLAGLARERAPTVIAEAVAQFFVKHGLQAGKKGGPHLARPSS